MLLIIFKFSFFLFSNVFLAGSTISEGDAIINVTIKKHRKKTNGTNLFLIINLFLTPFGNYYSIALFWLFHNNQLRNAAPVGNKVLRVGCNPFGVGNVSFCNIYNQIYHPIWNLILSFRLQSSQNISFDIPLFTYIFN